MSVQITLLRHGKADKTDPNHRIHPLSEEGRRQALERRIKLGEPTFDLVFHSGLPRTVETARLIAGLDENDTIFFVPDLFYNEDDPRGHVLERAFAKLGHATLREYYQEKGDGSNMGTRKAMESLANDAWGEIVDTIIEQSTKEVLVVGHGLLLQSLCIAIAEKEEPFMSRILGECQGYRLILEKGEVTEIEILD